MRGWFTFLVLSSVACSCAAQDGEPVCKPDGNQMEMNACAARDFKAADLALNQRYAALMASLPESKRAALRTEQRAWLKRRDPQCRKATKRFAGGSIWPLEFSTCLQKATEQRTRELADAPAN